MMAGFDWMKGSLVAAAGLVLAGCSGHGPGDRRAEGSLKDPYRLETRAQAPIKKRKPVRSSSRRKYATSPKPTATPPAMSLARVDKPAQPKPMATPIKEAVPPPPATLSRPALPVAPPVVPAPELLPGSAEPARRDPPRPAAPSARPRASDGQRLLDEGRALFGRGEVLAAREKYVAALTAPLPEVLLELARTYDPNYLDKLPQSDADADVDRAQALYEQAVALGAGPAKADLQRLQGGSAPPAETQPPDTQGR